MIRVDVDDRLDEMGSAMDTHIWFDMDHWFFDLAPVIKYAIKDAVE